MKKQIISILTVIICFSVFSGCANDEGVSKNNTKQVATTSEVTTTATTTTTSTALTTTSNKTTPTTTRKSSKIKDTKPITTSNTTTTRQTTSKTTTTQPTTVMQAQTMAQPQTTTSTSTQVTTTTPSITQPMKQKTHSSNGVCNHDIKVTGDWISVGGWYKTYEEAEFMAGKYIDEHGYGGNYLVEKCDKCGLWTPYVRNIQ